MILTPQDLIELTGKAKYAAQKRELDHLGIPAKLRRDGSLLVLWEDVRATQNVRPARRPQLRMDA